mmetsp:Transcript_19826/g.32148  ORF Transcript_19826/g.32148 Transcript_19826/m.32148 type:complete len:270 (+) Transcript_19826:1472-2281(+)
MRLRTCRQISLRSTRSGEQSVQKRKGLNDKTVTTTILRSVQAKTREKTTTRRTIVRTRKKVMLKRTRRSPTMKPTRKMRKMKMVASVAKAIKRKRMATRLARKMMTAIDLLKDKRGEAADVATEKTKKTKTCAGKKAIGSDLMRCLSKKRGHVPDRDAMRIIDAAHPGDATTTKGEKMMAGRRTEAAVAMDVVVVAALREDEGRTLIEVGVLVVMGAAIATEGVTHDGYVTTGRDREKNVMMTGVEETTKCRSVKTNGAAVAVVVDLRK